MQFETITKLLNLEPVKVIEVLDCNDDNLHLVVEVTDDTSPPVCSHCGKVHTSIHSRGQRRVEDLPLSGRRVFLYIEKRKCRCDDGRIRVEEYPVEKEKKMNKQEEQLIFLLRQADQSWLAMGHQEIVGLGTFH